MTVKSLRKQLAAAIAMTLVASVALGSSTYAWFVQNTKVTAEKVTVTAKTSYTLLISNLSATTAGAITTQAQHTAIDWVSNRELDTQAPVTVKGGDGTTSLTVYKSSDGATTYYVDTADSNKIYSAVSDADKTNWTVASVDLSSLVLQTTASQVLVPVSTIATEGAAPAFYKTAADAWATEEQHGTVAQGMRAGHFEAADGSEYYKNDFYITASQACKLLLDQDTSFTSNYGELDQVLRVAFRVENAFNHSASYDKTFVYEIDATDSDARSAITTTYTTMGNSNTNDIDGLKYAIKDATTSAAIACSNRDSAGKIYTLANRVVTAVPTGLVAASNQTNADVLYNFEKANDTCKVTVYIWMEGCDKQCTSAMATDLTEAVNAVLGNLSFCAGE